MLHSKFVPEKSSNLSTFNPQNEMKQSDSKLAFITLWVLVAALLVFVMKLK